MPTGFVAEIIDEEVCVRVVDSDDSALGLRAGRQELHGAASSFSAADVAALYSDAGGMVAA